MANTGEETTMKETPAEETTVAASTAEETTAEETTMDTTTADETMMEATTAEETTVAAVTAVITAAVITVVAATVEEILADEITSATSMWEITSEETTMEATSATKTEKSVMVVAIDDSEHSYYALKWVVEYLFAPFASNPPFKLVIVHVKPFPTSIIRTIGPPSAEVLSTVEEEIDDEAARVQDNAKEICQEKSVDAVLEMWEGDSRDVLCQIVEKHHASILAVGSHGYLPIQRVTLGSVSDYCALNANCTVMIVKKPKN